MSEPTSPIADQRWLDTVFSCKAAQRGMAVRRRLSDIERHVGYAAFKREVARQGFAAVRKGDTVMIYCTRGVVWPGG
ncbi:MAG: N-(5'-phosphoribosyl)anthranilate isomerase [Pseudomonadota bacterium]